MVHAIIIGCRNSRYRQPLKVITLNNAIIDSKLSMIVHRSNLMNLALLISKQQLGRDRKANQQHRQIVQASYNQN